METEYEQNRGERRSFYCPNSLWKKLVEECKGKCSVSEFVKEAIMEKLKQKSDNKDET